MDAKTIGQAPPTDDRLLVKWLEDQPSPDQKHLAEKKLTEYLEQAAQPRHASGNACIKLCYFVEQCAKSTASAIKDVAYSQETCLSLFGFYIEWNEKNQNRSMRQILELVSSLVNQNPNKEISKAAKDSILQRNLAIIGHKGAQPLVKPAFKSLEILLAKGTISPQELIEGYQFEARRYSTSGDDATNNAVALWDSLVDESFDWMGLPDVSPAAGKFLVTVFRQLRASTGSSALGDDHATSWQRWIRKGLTKDPESLENVKTYLFPPLFKLDRPGSLLFLEQINSQDSTSSDQSQELDAHALLRLAAMEVGKKAGLVEDPSTIQFQKAPKKKIASITIQEATISPLLVHSSDTVRSLAFSVMVSSLSSIRPFTPDALQMLQSSMSILYSDTDAKFRNDVLSNTKHMIERLRGAIAFLTREVETYSWLAESNSKPARTPKVPPSAAEMKEIHDLKEKHEIFLTWYLDFLLEELVPTSSYQRHITSLKAIQLLLKTGILGQDSGAPPQKVTDSDTIWPFAVIFFNPKSLRLLLDLLLDPFEDVRSTATSILKLAPSSAFSSCSIAIPQSDSNIRNAASAGEQDFKMPSSEYLVTQEVLSMDILAQFIKRANEASKRTGRADYADGVAHSYELLYSLLPSQKGKMMLFGSLLDDLESKVELAETDIGTAVLEAPAHSTFASLNFIWDSIDHAKAIESDLNDVSWTEFQQRMFQACFRIWQAVKDVLCNDSPEGHMPQDLDEADAIDTKDILSYSFRAIHEASNLIRTLADKIKAKRQDGSPIIPSDIFTSIGNLTFEQLSTLRHRGAFSTVTLTFARFCHLTQHLVSEQSPTLLEQYYQGALKCIFEQASTTRRSAGIPALLNGILSANARSPAFPDVMEELKKLSRQPVQLSETDETNLPQVHAMNCLKEIFKSATLGKRSESHMADGLQISADSLNSEIWAIRNCGLLLLRSLIDCLFGTSESKQSTEAGWDGRSIKLSYDKYPALPELLLKLLNTEISNSNEVNAPVIGAVESVFPALDIIRRAGPPNSSRAAIFDQVCKHLGSKVWHVRELAARTVCTLLMQDGWSAEIRKLIDSCDESTNKAHGTLIAIRFFLERRLDLHPASLQDTLPTLVDLLPQSEKYLSLERASSQLQAAKIEVINTLFLIFRSLDKSEQALQRPIIDHLFYSNGLEELKETLQPDSLEALLPLAVLRKSIFTSELRGDGFGPQWILEFVSKISTDLTLAALEILSPENVQITKENLPLSAAAYLAAVQNSSSAEVRSTAITYLAQALDIAFCNDISEHRDIITPLQSLPSLLKAGKSSPNLSNASIRISGWLLLEVRDDKLHLLDERMEAWGEMLTSAGDVYKDFETRQAAALAIHSLLTTTRTPVPNTESTLSSLLALYSTLNDDDDEIRDISALTVSSLLGKSLVPLAARQEFADWLVTSYHTSGYLSKCAFSRMVGEGTAESQLLSALEEDNKLFVEEEQNLFIDQVREFQLWSKILIDLDQSTKTVRRQELVEWTINGLFALNRLTNKRDGPLGWTSKPKAFVICWRVLSCAEMLLDGLGGGVGDTEGDALESDEKMNEIAVELEKAKKIVDLHPSLLKEIGNVWISSLLSVEGGKK